MIQKCLKTTNTTNINEILKKFSSEMRRGNAHNAIKLLTDNMKNGILPLTEKTLQQLKQKHPPSSNADPEVLLPGKPEEIHPIQFASIDAEGVSKATLKTRRGAGPSGLDAEGWKRLFTSIQFGDGTTDLCRTFAE